MSYYARDSRHRGNMDIATLKWMFDSWPDSNEYHISQCHTVSFKILICNDGLSCLN